MPAVLISRRRLFLVEVVDFSRIGGREHRERLLVETVEAFDRRRAIDAAGETVELREKFLSMQQPVGRHAVEQFEVRQFNAGGGGVIDAEGIVNRSERSSFITRDEFFPLVQFLADSDEPRNLRMKSFELRNHRAMRRQHVAGENLPAETLCPFDRTGEIDRPGDAVVVRFVMHRANDGVKRGAFRQLRKHFAEGDAGDIGRDRRVRSAVFERCVGLGIEAVDMARPSPQPEQNDRPGFRRRFFLSIRASPEQIGEREIERTESPDVEQPPAGESLAIASIQSPRANHAIPCVV